MLALGKRRPHYRPGHPGIFPRIGHGDISRGSGPGFRGGRESRFALGEAGPGTAARGDGKGQGLDLSADLMVGE